MIANNLPFTPGGLGVGEGAFASACIALLPTTAGIAYGTIFLILRCVLVTSTVPGLVVYLANPRLSGLRAPVDSATISPM
jgi:glycosyltransferase 2 family protein